MYRESEVCANQDGPFFARCIRCQSALCDRCAVFLVNGKPWCEPCGNAAADDARLPRWRVALAALSFLGFTALAALAWSSHHSRGLIGGVLGALFVPGSLLFPVMATERPRIERRHG